MSNSVDSDETAYYEPSHLDLCCFQKPIIITCGSERIKDWLIHSLNTLLSYTQLIGVQSRRHLEGLPCHIEIPLPTFSQ